MDLESQQILPLKCYSLREAAEVLRVSSRTLQRAIRAGNLKAARIGDRVILSEAELVRFVSGSA